MIMLVREWSTLYRADIPRRLGKHEITRESASAWSGHCVRHRSPQPPSRHAHNGAKAWALGSDKAECDARFITHIYAVLANCGTSLRSVPHLQSRDD